jgi:hypothetical protein
MCKYDITSTSQIHAPDASNKGGSEKTFHDTVTFSVSGGDEAPFQVAKTTRPAQQ